MSSLLDICREFVAVRDLDDFTRVLERATACIGLRTFAASTLQERPDGQPCVASVENVPDSYREHFYDADGGKTDPVMQHCKHSSLPIVWNRDTYAAVGQDARWEFMASHGLRWGICSAMHLAHRRHFLIGLDSDEPASARDAERMVADVQVLLVYAQSAADAVLQHAAVVTRPSITGRELEVLQWTADGKTAWEVGAILGVSEHTVTKHLESAKNKLGCVNKRQAAIQALRLGLID